MRSVNKIILLGNLGRDAELRYTPSGTAVATFTLATNERWTDKDGEKKEHTEWHRVVLWGKMAESLAQYLTKGNPVYVEGSVRTKSYKDKEGNERQSFDVRAREVVLLPSGGSGGGKRTAPDEPPPIGDDDIPF